MRNAGIVGVGSYVPPRVLTNQEMESIVDTSDEWIVTRTGIRERHIAGPDEASSDLGLEAARRALADAGVDPGEVDLVVTATISGDMIFPATASIIQHRIGASRAAAFDIGAGCTGFIYALTTGAQFVASGMYETVLVVGADTLSKLLNWKDRTTCVLFGDGAGAAVLKPVPEGYGVLGSVLGSDGSGTDLLKVEAGISRRPASHETVDSCLHTIRMAGSEVFKFATRVMGEAALGVLDKCGLRAEDVSLFIPHQANTRIIDSAARRLGLAPEKVFINIENYGNTSAASIPLALDEAVQGGKVHPGDLLVLVGFGAGLTWGACAVRWGNGSDD
ncbi:MAG: ketoacyl-ACP synthase III [Armatimonadetes bacterium]|nr:ketoacyl-ACP synthase III [Armatimonadota bacterium]